ncbi:hypothetical protein [Phycicoccus duodecadis]|uniref:Serine/threonine protein kinase n=1 Tax=Phycicoccus duodecadis TaxID=173053 RepID=A0A2N3YM54_9MICO|nr:hypothetical protein [Phycicoccus duodecadis]PKW27947.1 hypothetical protein ATL31_2798 [Phycicoccus duodecadis]
MKGVGPGTVLGGRYTVQRRLAQDRGTERWTAEDSTLGRSVSVMVIARDDHRAAAFLDAARRAGAISHAVLVRILDVGQDADVAFVVEESLDDARTLAQLVTDGGIPGDEVRRITGEVASALESARQRGVHHLDLTPDDVLRGLEVAGVRAGEDGLEPDEASRRDAVGVVGLTYAGLTGLWPLGAGGSGLGPAPRVPGGVASPSEISAGVPRDLDALCRLTLNDDQGPTSPGDYARQVAPWPSRQVVGRPVVAQRPQDAVVPSTVEPVSGPPVVPPAPVAPLLPAAATPPASSATATSAPSASSVTAEGAAADAALGSTATLPVIGGDADPSSDPGGSTADLTALDEPTSPEAGAPLADGPRRPPPPAWLDDEDAADVPVADEPTGAGARAAGMAAGAAGVAAGAAAAVGGWFSARTAAVRGTDDETEGRAEPVADDADAPAERHAVWSGGGATDAGPADGGRTDPGSAGAATGAAAAFGTVGSAVTDFAKRAVDKVSELSPDTERPHAAAPMEPAAPLTRDESKLALAIVGVFLVLALVIGVIGVKQIGSRTDLGLSGPSAVTGAGASPSPSGSAQPSASGSAGAAEPLAILKVSAYDPEGDNNENDQLTPKTYDGNPDTGWKSEQYRTDDFGGLKKGVGLIVDLGPNKKPQEVQLTVPKAVDVEVYVGADASLEGATKIGAKTDAKGRLDFPVPADVSGQYIVLWYTSLHVDENRQRRAWLNEVVVTG